MAGLKFVFGLVLIVLLSTVVNAGAQQPPATIRLPAGLVFDVPPGWGWSELQQRGPNLVTLDFGATRPQQGVRQNVNLIDLSMPRDASLDKYVRVDSERTERFANGVSLSWRTGLKFQPHYGYDALALIGSKHLRFQVLDTVTPRFDKARIQDAVAKIAGSLKDVAASNSIFHPIHRFAVDRDFQNWRPRVLEPAVSFGCTICGTAVVNLYVFPVTSFTGDMDAAFAALSKITAVNGVNTEKVQRAALPNAEFRWSEQPGTRMPLTGVMQLGGMTFFVYIFGALPPPLTMDAARANLLAIARTVRPWDGR